MINELNTEQTNKLNEYCNKWLDIGLSTSDTDVEKALEAIKLAYETAGLTPPDKYENYDSPFEAITEMKIRYNIDISLNAFVFGAHDASWLSYYNYFQEVCKLEDCNKLQGLMDFAKYSGWALLFDELIVLTRKPIQINFDENKTLHNETDYAIKYADGVGITAWHGTKIPEEWIFDKSSITTDVLFKWSNVEERRCACEIIGWAEVLRHLSATIVDEDPEPTIGVLLEVDLPDSGKEKFLLVKDPNVDKKVGIPVPKEMKTALEANSWTYGIDMVDFKPEFRV